MSTFTQSAANTVQVSAPTASTVSVEKLVTNISVQGSSEALPATVTKTPPSVVTVSAQDANQIIIESIGVQGPPGEDGSDFEYPINPVFTYGPEGLSRIDYDNGWNKVFVYSLDGKLSEITSFFLDVTKKKTITYNIDGSVMSIIEVVI